MTTRINMSDICGPVRFLVPPEGQGQMVEVSYAGIYDGRVLRRTHDRSDGSISYAVARLHACEQDDETPCGLNGAPRIVGKWRRCEVI